MRSLSLRSGNSPTTPYGGRVNGVGSRTGAPPVGPVNPAPLVTFPTPASSNAACGFPALRFPACFASRVMWPFASGALSEQPIAAASYSTSSNRAPSVSAGFSLLLHVYPLSQVPQFNRRLYHLASASLVAKVITDSGAASLHRRYPASLVLPTPPPPSRLSADFPVLPVIRPTFAPPISRRGEEGFSSCLARPRHRAVATTPPECRSASASLRCVILLSSSEGGLSLPGFDVSGPPLHSLALRPGDSPTTLTVTCRWASKSQFPFSLPSKLRGSGSFPGGLVPR